MTMKKAAQSRASAFQRRGSGAPIGAISVCGLAVIATSLPWASCRTVSNNPRKQLLSSEEQCCDTLLSMPTSRTYGDGCGIAHAMDLVGERWGLLVVRELLLGPKRFTDLRAGLPNASPNVLSQRLRELEGAGLVRRRKLPPPAASWVYELTEWG